MMKTKLKLTRLWCLMLSLVLCLSLLPATAAAADYFIESVTVTGIRMPVPGETAAENLQRAAVSYDSHCTLYAAYWTYSENGKSWYTMDDDDTFVEGYYYHYMVWLKPDQNFHFGYYSAVGDSNYHEFTGTTQISLEAKYSKVYIDPDDSEYMFHKMLNISGVNFRLSPTYIDSVTVTGLRTPVVGETQTENLKDLSVPDGSAYSIVKAYWMYSADNYAWRSMGTNDTFVNGYYYRYQLMLKADDGCLFGYSEDGVRYHPYTGTTSVPLSFDTSAVYYNPANADHLQLSISGAPLQVWSSAFTDVPAGAYYEDAVNWAVEMGITNGTSETTFSPDKNCTRGQIVTFLWRLYGSPEPASTTCSYTDVPKSEYYYKAVLWAVEKGITNGTSPTTFSPNAACTRGQAMTFLWRAANKPAASGSAGNFKDVPSGAYYAAAVQWAVGKGITNGTSPTTFSPEKACSRAHIVTFLYRYMNNPD